MDHSLFTREDLKGRLYEEYAGFLLERGLRDEADWDRTALFFGEDGDIAACGSLKGDLIKQVAVDSSLEGSGLASSVISVLSEEAAGRGVTKLFLWTKEDSRRLFESLGFYTLVSTDDIVMMENRRRGLESFLRSCPLRGGKVGAIVCNCNPFTLGHYGLMKTAAAQVDHLLIFVLSSDSFLFSSEERYEMVKAGTADIPNAEVIRGGDYLISPSLFPAYFIKDEARIPKAHCELDLTLFAERIAPALNISRRFVGSEPFDPVTAEYNRRMKELLPSRGIEVVEIERIDGINATSIRRAISEGRLEEYRSWMPESSYEFCKRKVR